jgi:hypothetical protein
MIDTIKRLTSNPKTLFLVDGLGALLTAFFLFTILRTFNEYFGMPQKIVTYLSFIAVIFSFYSISCFFLVKDNWHLFLRIISTANLLYCCLTMSLLIYYYQSLTILGITYFVAEISIICGLVLIELKMLRK